MSCHCTAGQCHGQRARQSGVALAIVVWFIAGMSLLVVGIVAHTRLDTKMAQAHMARAKVVSAGDGAIRLMLAELQLGLAATQDVPGVYRARYRVGDTDVQVILQPSKGLFDLNVVDFEEMAALLVAAGLEDGAADELADNVIRWREGMQGEGTPRANNNNSRRNRFNTGEDLLRVEGMGRTVYDGLRDYVVAGRPAAGSIDWTLAPQGLVDVLRQVNSARAAGIMRRRDQADRSGSRASAGPFRADAIVSWGGRQWLRRKWVTSGGSAKSALSWREVRTEPPRVIAGEGEHGDV